MVAKKQKKEEKKDRLISQREFARIVGIAGSTLAEKIQMGLVRIVAHNRNGWPLLSAKDAEVMAVEIAAKRAGQIKERAERIDSRIKLKEQNRKARTEPVEQAPEKEGPKGSTLYDVKKRQAIISMRLQELELAKKEGEVVEVKRITSKWHDLSRIMRQHYESLPERVSATLASTVKFKLDKEDPEKVVILNQREMSDLLNEEIGKILDNLSDALRV
jgi:hypothetical protein